MYSVQLVIIHLHRTPISVSSQSMNLSTHNLLRVRFIVTNRTWLFYKHSFLCSYTWRGVQLSTVMWLLFATSPYKHHHTRVTAIQNAIHRRTTPSVRWQWISCLSGPQNRPFSPHRVRPEVFHRLQSSRQQSSLSDVFMFGHTTPSFNNCPQMVSLR